MHSQSHEVEPGPDATSGRLPPGECATGVPLRCHRPMRPAVLTVPTPLSLLGTMLMALLALPRGALLASALLRMRHHRRA